MEDNKLLEELRAQQELIRKHLQWLDQKIAALDGGDHKSAAVPVAVTEESKATPETAVEEQNDKNEPAEEPEEHAESWFNTYKAPAGDDILRAKTGCLVLFVLSSLLFLFLLFGLPYLMD